MVICLFLVFIIVLLAYMYAYMYGMERKFAERYKSIAHEFDKEFKDLQKECELMKSKIEGIEKTTKK